MKAFVQLNRSVHGLAPERSEVTGGAASLEDLLAPVVLSVRNLHKSYGAQTVLKDVSFEVRRGEIFGLLGQNGAGKTTILETIQGLRDPDEGEIMVAGVNLKRDLRKVRGKLGVSLQTADFWGQLKVREVIDLFRSFYPKPLPRARLLEMTGLGEIQGKMLRQLSGGQKQKVNLCLALVNDPEVILLDEPTVGLDPEARRSLWAVVKQLRQEQKTIVLTTHYLEEAQALCDRVAILHKGAIVRCASPASLVAKEESQAVITARLTAHSDEDLQTALEGSQKPGEVADGLLTVRSHDVRETVQLLYKWADMSGLVLENLRIGGPSLEDVFLAVVSNEPKGKEEYESVL